MVVHNNYSLLTEWSESLKDWRCRYESITSGLAYTSLKVSSGPNFTDEEKKNCPHTMTGDAYRCISQRKETFFFF